MGGATDDKKDLLDRTLRQLKLKASVTACRIEGAFLVCDIALEPGGKVRQIELRATEIALAMRGLADPIIYPVPNEGVVRMELMVVEQAVVPFKEIVSDPKFSDLGIELPLVLGKTRQGEVLVSDLTDMPHLLVAGATGTGKSTLLRTIIGSMLMRKRERKVLLALIDPKQVEFSWYDGIQQLYRPVARDSSSAVSLLYTLVDEMEERLTRFRKVRCRDILHYKVKMPYIVVVVDELAELMMTSRRDTQELVCRLAQKSRACGIYLVVATQRPSVDVITGLIKSNFPCRLSCRVSSATDSRVILDRNGAERLAGKGDAILDMEGKSVRFKGAYLSDVETVALVREYGKKRWWPW